MMILIFYLYYAMHIWLNKRIMQLLLKLSFTYLRYRWHYHVLANLCRPFGLFDSQKTLNYLALSASEESFPDTRALKILISTFVSFEFLLACTYCGWHCAPRCKQCAVILSHMHKYCSKRFTLFSWYLLLSGVVALVNIV